MIFAITHLIPSCGIFFEDDTRAVWSMVQSIMPKTLDFFLLLDRVICIFYKSRVLSILLQALEGEECTWSHKNIHV